MVDFGITKLFRSWALGMRNQRFVSSLVANVRRSAITK